MTGDDGVVTAANGRVVWIIGGGSGIGRAAAHAAAGSGWRVVVSGRREEALAETVAAMPAADATVLPLDARDPVAVTEAANGIRARFGRIDGVVLANGLNSPRRGWADQDLAEFGTIVDTNLIAAAGVITATLPSLRESGGAVVIVSSYSAWAFNPVAGVAYSASKAGLSALTRTLNAQEAAHGVRACHLCPGDVDTDFLRLRPSVPDANARAVMLSPDDVARSVVFVLDSPPHVRIDELVISPISQR